MTNLPAPLRAELVKRLEERGDFFNVHGMGGEPLPRLTYEHLMEVCAIELLAHLLKGAGEQWIEQREEIARLTEQRDVAMHNLRSAQAEVARLKAELEDARMDIGDLQARAGDSGYF